MIVPNAAGLDLKRWAFAGPVERAYELSRAPVTAIVGPTGGGKTTGSARRCFRVATWQHASPRDGVRRARILCICPTYRRAWDTVIPSWLKVFPATVGLFTGSKGDPAQHIIDMTVSINGRPATIHLEVLFRAVNDLDIEEFFRGFEFTALWLPEADTNNDLKTILSLGSNRVGRYPEPEDRPDPDQTSFDAYKGIFCDANAPIIGSHFYERFYQKQRGDGERAPESDLVLIQPSGFSVNAENLQNLRRIDRNFYRNQAALLDVYDRRRMLENRPGFGRHGQPVHPNFDQDTHVAKRDLEPDPRLPVYIGVDAGSGSLQVGATFSQRGYGGQWRTFAEIYLGKDTQMNTPDFGAEIRSVLNRRFGTLHADVGALLCGDPAMNDQNSQTSFTTAMALQAATEIELQLAPTNKLQPRRTAIDRLFKHSIGPREPAKIIDPSCLGLIAGYAGGFHYQRRANVVAATPKKNEYSHVVEADEYAALTIDGVDLKLGGFIRPDGERGDDGLRVLMDN